MQLLANPIRIWSFELLMRGFGLVRNKKIKKLRIMTSGAIASIEYMKLASDFRICLELKDKDLNLQH